MHVNIFLNQKKADHIQVAIDRILSEIDFQQTKAPICWQLQVSNVTSPVLVTICLLPAWEAATRESDIN